MLSGLDPLWEVASGASFFELAQLMLTYRLQANEMLRSIRRPASMDGGAGMLTRDVGCAGGS